MEVAITLIIGFISHLASFSQVLVTLLLFFGFSALHLSYDEYVSILSLIGSFVSFERGTRSDLKFDNFSM